MSRHDPNNVLHNNCGVECRFQKPGMLPATYLAKDQIVSFRVKNIATLNTEGVHDLILSIVIPRLAYVWQDNIRRLRMLHVTNNVTL